MDPGDDGAPIPVTLWEAYREGIDDHRYLFTLENTIARAEEAGHKEAAGKARAVLAQLNASINVQTKYKNDGLWSLEAFDACAGPLPSRSWRSRKRSNSSPLRANASKFLSARHFTRDIGRLISF